MHDTIKLHLFGWSAGGDYMDSHQCIYTFSK